MLEKNICAVLVCWKIPFKIQLWFYDILWIKIFLKIRDFSVYGVLLICRIKGW